MRKNTAASRESKRDARGKTTVIVAVQLSRRTVYIHTRGAIREMPPRMYSLYYTRGVLHTVYTCAPVAHSAVSRFAHRENPPGAPRLAPPPREKRNHQAGRVLFFFYYLFILFFFKI